MPDRWDGGTPRRPPQDPLGQIIDLSERLRERLGDAGRSGGPRFNPLWLLGAVGLIWLLSGIYIVAPDQRGVILRFGKMVGETDPGPHYHLPWPIERVLTPSVTAIRKEEIGFRTVDVGPPARYQDVDDEALMLTGDENIVKLEFIVQYKVRPDASGTADFLFNIRDPDGTVRAAAEAAMREVVGRTPIDQVLTEGKEQVQVEAQRVLQEILDRYGSGIEVVTLKLQDVDPPGEVSDAFKDVISAQQDKERLINEARGYANDVVPRARGQAAQLVNEAEGYRGARIREATGAAKRFVALQEEYAKAKDVTRTRLYLEAMESVLPGANKIVMDDLAGKQTVPYLPLEPLVPRREVAKPDGQAAGGGR
jgi:membrane protease subunit HflK